MANNINLSAGRAVNAAISHVENNAFRFTNVGMIQALRANTKLIQETNPFSVMEADGGKNLLAYKDGTYNPRILLNHKPASSQGNRTSRIAAGGITGSNGVAAIQASTQVEVLFNKTIEFEIYEDLFTSDIFKEPKTVDYLNKLANPAVRASAMADSQYNPAKRALGVVGYEILSRTDADLVTPLGEDLITIAAAGVGKNAAFPTWDTVGGTEDAPIVSVNAFESDGVSPCVDLWDAILDTQRMNRFTGKPLLVGGQKMARYMQKRGVVSIADNGFNLAALTELPVLWYFDALIDEVYGADQIIMLDNGAACMQTWLDHSPYGLVRTNRHQNMYFGNITINVGQFGVSGSQVGENLMLDMDYRVLEGLAVDLPTNSIVPSMRYGVFKRPAGFFTSDTSNILNKVTGIFAFKLTNKA